MSEGWAVDLKSGTAPSEAEPRTTNNGDSGPLQTAETSANASSSEGQLEGVTAVYEELIPETGRDLVGTSPDEEGSHRGADGGSRKTKKMEVETMDTQEFLAIQLEVLERLRREEEEKARTTAGQKLPRLVDPTLPKFARENPDGTPMEVGDVQNLADEGLVREHIGPVQFNVGGIQVDADDMLKRLAVSDLFIFPLPPLLFQMLNRLDYFLSHF